MSEPQVQKCGGTCGGDAVQETLRQWTGGAWYDVTWVRCLNITRLTRMQREHLAAERRTAIQRVKCNWREELSRVERPGLPPPTITARQSWKESPMPVKSPERVAERKYTEDQIRTCVNLVLDSGWSIPKAAESVGIHPPSASAYVSFERKRRANAAKESAVPTDAPTAALPAPAEEAAPAAPAAPPEIAAAVARESALEAEVEQPAPRDPEFTTPSPGEAVAAPLEPSAPATPNRRRTVRDPIDRAVQLLKTVPFGRVVRLHQMQEHAIRTMLEVFA